MSPSYARRITDLSNAIKLSDAASAHFKTLLDQEPERFERIDDEDTATTHVQECELDVVDIMAYAELKGKTHVRLVINDMGTILGAVASTDGDNDAAFEEDNSGLR